MGTTINQVLVMATTKSNHMVTTIPVPSMIPPMAPPTPTGVPAPFPYMSRSATAKKTSTKLIVGRGETMLENSSLKVMPPGNQPSQPAPLHDLVTMQVNAKIWQMA
jgi:hypothetical protein